MNYLLRRNKLGRGSCNGIKAVSTTGIDVVMNNNFPVEASEGGIVFRWGCTSNLPGRGHKVINKTKAIHWCANKRQGRLDMQTAGVPVPKTWGSLQQFDNDWNEDEDHGRYVIRKSQHAQGRDLVTGNHHEAADQLAVWNEDGYISELIPKVAEYRVMVIQNRVAWIAQKTPANPDEVAWNVAQGGRFDNVRWNSWPMKVVTAALAAAKVGELDFGGVDVMVDAEGNPYVLEVNSAPSQTSPYRLSCVAKCFDHIVLQGRDHFADVEGNLSWKKVIHPAVRGE